MSSAPGSATRRLLVLLLALVLTACASAGPPSSGGPRSSRDGAARAASIRHLLILHLNDVSGLDRGPDGPGLARAAAVVRRARAGIASSLVTGGGDLLGPSPASLLLAGEPAAAAWQALGLDVATPGERDLALGPAALAGRIAESGARWTAVNLRRAGAPDSPCCGVEGTVLLDLGGVRVGVAGVIEASAVAALKTGRLGIEVTDPVLAARDAVRHLRARGAQVVVLLAHGEPLFLEFLGHAARPDLVLGGHAGAPLALEAGPALVVRTSPGGRDVARIDLFVREADGVVVGRSLRFLPVAGTDPDPALQRLAGALPDRLEAAAAAVGGWSSVPFDTRRRTVGTGETPLGNLLADLARARLGTDIALIDAGSLADAGVLAAGPIPAGFPLRLLPDLGPLAKLEVTGADLLATLEHGLGRLPAPSGRFLQLSGLHVTYRAEAPPGRRVEAVSIGREPLDPSRRYTVATTARLAAGASGHAWLRGAPRLVPAEAGPLLADLLLTRMRTGLPLAPRIEGRIRTAEPRGLAGVMPRR